MKKVFQLLITACFLLVAFQAHAQEEVTYRVTYNNCVNAEAVIDFSKKLSDGFRYTLLAPSDKDPAKELKSLFVVMIDKRVIVTRNSDYDWNQALKQVMQALAETPALKGTTLVEEAEPTFSKKTCKLR